MFRANARLIRSAHKNSMTKTKVNPRRKPCMRKEQAMFLQKSSCLCYVDKMPGVQALELNGKTYQESKPPDVCVSDLPLLQYDPGGHKGCISSRDVRPGESPYIPRGQLEGSDDPATQYEPWSDKNDDVIKT